MLTTGTPAGLAWFEAISNITDRQVLNNKALQTEYVSVFPKARDTNRLVIPFSFCCEHRLSQRHSVRGKEDTPENVRLNGSKVAENPQENPTPISISFVLRPS